MAIPGNQQKTLHIAAMDGDCAAIQRWLDAGLFVDKRDAAKRTGLHQAAWSGRVEVVTLLLGAYAEVDSRDNERRTPLHYCSETGCTAVMKELIAFKADIDAKDSRDETPLSKAARAGKVEAVKILLEADAKIDIRDTYGHLAGDFFSSKVPPETREKILKMKNERREELVEGKRMEKENRRADIAKTGPQEKKRSGCGCCVS